MQQIVFDPEISKLADIQTIERQLTNFRGQTGYSGWVLFRGQADANWTITPSIVRYGHTPEEIRQFEPLMINEFAQRIAAEGLSMHWQKAVTNEPYHNEWLQLQQAQHYRLPTRLLDWTLKPGIAQAFAVLDATAEGQEGALFMYMATPGEQWEAEGPRNYLYYNPYEMVVANDFAIISPSVHYDENTNHKIAEKRLARQGGKFILRDYSNISVDLAMHADFKQRLYKFIIPKEAKLILRDELKNKMRDPITALSIYYHESEQVQRIVDQLRSHYGLIHRK